MVLFHPLAGGAGRLDKRGHSRGGAINQEVTEVVLEVPFGVAYVPQAAVRAYFCSARQAVSRDKARKG